MTVESEVDSKGEVITMNFSFAKFKEGWRLDFPGILFPLLSRLNILCY